MNNAARKLIWASIVLSSVFATGAASLYAQDEQPPSGTKTKPAGTTYPIPIVGTGDQPDQNNQLVPDTTPLTGILNPTLGTPGIRHSYWMPGIQYSSSIQSNGYQQQGQTPSWLVNNYFVGNVSLLKAFGHSQLAVNYSAGGFISTDSTQGNGYYQQLALTQTFNWNRLQLQLLDQFSYLPQSSFGFGSGGGGLGTPGTGGPLGPVIPGMGGGTIPNQSIYAAVGPRYSNSAAAQLTYLTSPRGSITFTGSYGLLSFVDEGNVDNDSITGSVGYNYALNSTDTIGLFYRFSAYHFPGQPQAIGNHSFNLAYGRKVTGHIALQLYAGPDFTTSRVSMNGGDTSSHGVSAGASMQYGFEAGTWNLSVSHGVSGGGGVLTGTSSDLISTGLSHQLSRVWGGQVNFGYSRNSPINIASQVNSMTYNTYTIGGGVNRPLGRNATFSVGYNLNIPDYSLPGCSGSLCPSSPKLHYITINFQWHTRPLVLP